MSRYDYLCNSEINDRNNFAYFLQEPQQLLQQIIQVKGEDGKSAYEIAKELGFSGSEQQWLSSLKGANGKSAYQSAVDNGFSGTEAEWIESMRNQSYSKTEIDNKLTNIYNKEQINNLLLEVPKIKQLLSFGPPIAIKKNNQESIYQQGDFVLCCGLSNVAPHIFYLRNLQTLTVSNEEYYCYEWVRIGGRTVKVTNSMTAATPFMSVPISSPPPIQSGDLIIYSLNQDRDWYIVECETIYFNRLTKSGSSVYAEYSISWKNSFNCYTINGINNNYYNKTEINDMIGNIESLLSEV